MLKSSTGKLYTLLMACKPENEKIRKRLLITEILEMPEYKALQVYPGATSTMDDHYSPARLQEATSEQLYEIKQIIPFLEQCIRALYNLVCYGDVRILRKIKKISFYKAESMRNLYDLVVEAQNVGINITNIPEYDVWSFFSPDTIRSLDDYIDIFEGDDVEVFETQIVDKLKDTIYCISAQEISERRSKYRNLFRQRETIRLRLQIVENKIFVKKSICSVFSMAFVVSLFSGSEVLFSTFGRGFALVVYLIGLLAYWILG